MVAACALTIVACKDTRSATRPPPPGEIAAGATHAEIVDPRGTLVVQSTPATKPPPVDNPFDAPPTTSGSADPLAPKKQRPTHL